jgi:cellulose synthase/poly-beta-1,6-N-acetylglucosamine synthase-like glycosyltransferase
VARLSLTAVLLGIATVGLLGLALWIASGASPRSPVGLLPVGISYNVPAVPLLMAAVVGTAALFVALAALHTAAAMRVLARDRRIPEPLSEPARRLRGRVLGPVGIAALQLDREPDLPPTSLPESTAQPSRQRVTVTVLVPAHNEEFTVTAALSSLSGQTRPPDKVIVVADNCTDRTEAVARAHGAEVFTTQGNTEKKAGALNQALTAILPSTSRQDVVMVMDADTVIVPEFLATATARLEADPDLIAVGGVFYGEAGAGLIGQLQRNEYTRYQRYISRRLGKVFVLTGTASLFRAYALRAVANARGTLIPGTPDVCYDTLALTEDNEMTLALKTLGARMVSPMQCRTITEVMPTWRMLWRQRMRWQRGALENIGAYGLTRTTLIYWLQQIGIGYGTIALNAYLLLMLITLLAADGFEVLWFWALIGCVFVVERLVTVWSVGWRGRVLAFPLVIEIAYDLVLQAVFVKSLFDIATGRASGWDHVPRAEARQ